MKENAEFYEKPLPRWVSSVFGLVLLALGLAMTLGLAYLTRGVIQRPTPNRLDAVIFLMYCLLVPINVFTVGIGYRLSRQRSVSAESIMSPLVYYIAAGFFAMMLAGFLVASIQYDKWATTLPIGLGLVASIWKLVANGNKKRRSPGVGENAL